MKLEGRRYLVARSMGSWSWSWGPKAFALGENKPFSSGPNNQLVIQLAQRGSRRRFGKETALEAFSFLMQNPFFTDTKLYYGAKPDYMLDPQGFMKVSASVLSISFISSMYHAKIHFLQLIKLRADEIFFQ